MNESVLVKIQFYPPLSLLPPGGLKKSLLLEEKLGSQEMISSTETLPHR